MITGSQDTMLAMPSNSKSSRLLELRRGVREKSRLRGWIMDLARAISETDAEIAYLILAQPDLTSETIKEVWEEAAQLFRADLVARLSLIEVRGHEPSTRCFVSYPDPPNNETLAEIKELLAETPSLSVKRPSLASGNSFYDVLRLLVARWMDRDAAPITLTELGKQTGYTYKPVRKALDELEPHLAHFGNRGNALSSFPTEAWSKLLLEAPKVRETLRFRSKGESSRTPEAMLRRFLNIDETDVAHVALGGVVGTRHRFSEIDLMGLPRLDFTIHCPESDPDLSFLRKVDAALAPVDDPNEPCSVAIHHLRRPAPYFEGRHADSAECLLDLLEMRLDSQAEQFLHSFSKKAGDRF